MSGRQIYLAPIVSVEPSLLYKALTDMARSLELADWGQIAPLNAALGSNSIGSDEQQAWMVTAYLIADMCDIDPHKLIQLANSVWKGSQDAIF